MNAVWYIRRIQKMNAREVWVKAFRQVFTLVRSRRIRQIRTPLILNIDASQAMNHLAAEAPLSPEVLVYAERILAGERFALGCGWILPEDWHWHRDVLSGTEWPRIASSFIDFRAQRTEIRMCWELNRFHDIYTLARAFFSSGDEKYIVGIKQLLQDWMINNPIGIGPNWISSMEAAIRMVNLTSSAQMIRNHDDEELALLMGVMMNQHLQFVECNVSHGSSANNHVLVELMGIVYAYAFWTDQSYPLQHYLDVYTDALKLQLYPSGLHKEMSSHYHLFVAESAVHVRFAATTRNIRVPQLDDCLTRMREVIYALTTEEGICRFGDDDDGAIMRFYEKGYQWDFVLSGHTTNPWIHVPNFHPTQTEGLRNFDGIWVIQKPAFRVVVDAGPHGLVPLYAHAHADDMSLYVAIHGKWVITDPGTYAYYFDPEVRQLLCSLSVHNGPLSDEEDGTYKLMSGPFMWMRAPDQSSIERIEETPELIRVTLVKQGESGHSFTRTITCTSQHIQVDDRASSSKPFTSIFTFSPEVSITPTNHCRWCLDVKGTSLSLTSNRMLTPGTTTYSPAFGQAVTTTAVAIRGQNQTRIAFEFGT